MFYNRVIIALDLGIDDLNFVFIFFFSLKNNLSQFICVHKRVIIYKIWIAWEKGNKLITNSILLWSCDCSERFYWVLIFLSIDMNFKSRHYVHYL